MPYQTCHNHAKVAVTILKCQDPATTGYSHHAALIIAELEKLVHSSGQNIPLPSRLDQKHQTLYRFTKSHIIPATTMQLYLQLF